MGLGGFWEITSLRATHGGSSLGDLFVPQVVKERPTNCGYKMKNEQAIVNIIPKPAHSSSCTRILRVVFLLLLCRDEEIRTLGLQLPKLAR